MNIDSEIKCISKTHSGVDENSSQIGFIVGTLVKLTLFSHSAFYSKVEAKIKIVK